MSKTDKPPRLTFRSVGKTFPNVVALDDVSFEVHQGEVLALMGENGAGKSTLLKILAGDYVADSGSVLLDGKDVPPRGPTAARRLGLRVVHQEPDIVPELTVAENIFLGEAPRSALRFVNWRRLNGDARRLMKNFRFCDNLDESIRAESLTAAGRQMVEILRGLREGLKVIALDEPTSSLSDSESDDLFRAIEELRTEGVAIIYVSHRMKEISRVADRIAVLRDGCLVGEVDAKETSEKELIRMMVGRDLATHHRGEVNPGAPRLEVEALCSRDVQDISFKVASGEVVGLAGLVGAGRTELAKTIFGDIPSTSGRVVVDGRPVQIGDTGQAVAHGLAYVPEERKSEGIFPELSVRENASIAVLKRLSRKRFVDGRKEQSRVAEIVDRMRVKTPSLDQPIAKLSGGNQQKVILSRWLLAEPKAILLDEPTRGIDVGAKSEIYTIIGELAAAGLAVVVISSELPELLAITDRILCMAGGRIVADVDTRRATEESILQHCMVQHTAAQPDAAGTLQLGE